LTKESRPSPGGFGIKRTESIPATEENRDKLIERAKAFIEEQRKLAETSFAEEREVITAALQDCESAKGRFLRNE
jgi:CHASE3 domain sensor protein